MHFSPSFFCWVKPIPSGTRSLGFSKSRMKPSPRHGNACRIISLHAPHHGMEEWYIIQSFCHGLIRSAQEHITATAGGSFFALNIEEARKLVEKMASNQSWDEERTQTRTRKVHQLEEVDMLTTKIDLLMKKLENLGLDHLKMVDARVTCEECRETDHMGINCPTVSQDVNFIGNSYNGFHPNQGFNACWNKPSFPFDNHQQASMW
jgi:hypothetical protein